MSFFKKAIGVVILAVIVYCCFCPCGKFDRNLVLHPDDFVWGSANSADESIREFKVAIPDSVLTDLRQRLASWTPVDNLENVGYTYGMDSKALTNVIKYWREKYDWKAAEKKLNSLKQYKTVIQGLDVHFLHVKGCESATKRIPLLIMHGWPGSILEFYGVIPKLTACHPDGLTYDIVAPSIPGYTFSDASQKAGFDGIAAAQIFASLMKRVGYDRYLVQGGDWGAMIGNLFVRIFPERVIGFHTNFPIPPMQTPVQILRWIGALLVPEWVVGKEDAAKMNRSKLFHLALEETGYMHEHGTKPDTIGVGLSDSPAGLAAWIFEKCHSWTHHAEFKDGQGLKTDDILTNIMMYWVTNHVTSAMRFYKEVMQNGKWLDAWMSHPVTVPVAVAAYPFELMNVPRSVLYSPFPKMVHYVDQPSGGHFAAWEEPDLFAADLRIATWAIINAEKQDKKN